MIDKHQADNRTSHVRHPLSTFHRDLAAPITDFFDPVDLPEDAVDRFGSHLRPNARLPMYAFKNLFVTGRTKIGKTALVYSAACTHFKQSEVFKTNSLEDLKTVDLSSYKMLILDDPAFSSTMTPQNLLSLFDIQQDVQMRILYGTVKKMRRLIIAVITNYELDDLIPDIPSHISEAIRTRIHEVRLPNRPLFRSEAPTLFREQNPNPYGRGLDPKYPQDKPRGWGRSV